MNAFNKTEMLRFENCCCGVETPEHSMSERDFDARFANRSIYGTEEILMSARSDDGALMMVGVKNIGKDGLAGEMQLFACKERLAHWNDWRRDV